MNAAESRFNQSRLAYEKAVLNAFKDVSDSLNKFYKAGETLDAVLDLERASTEYLSLASKRYRNGVLTYIDVLDARRSLFEAQLSASQARQSQLLALVSLYKALGGGWGPEAIAALAEKKGHLDPCYFRKYSIMSWLNAKPPANTFQNSNGSRSISGRLPCSR